MVTKKKSSTTKKNLVIVESPAKAKTIEKYLGRNYKVMASVGHIRDLKKSTMSIDFDNNYEPEYINIRGKGPLINDLKKEAKKAKQVFLASDPDREGEAISWHLAHILNLDAKEKNRVVFNEITKDAVKNAFKEPRQIDMDLVDAQQARRVLDRIVGYSISPILWKKVKKGLSAAWYVVIGICSAPVSIPLAVALGALVIAIFVALIGCVAAVFAAIIGCFVAAVAFIVFGFMAVPVAVPTALLFLGIGIGTLGFMAAMGVLLAMGVKAGTSAMVSAARRHNDRRRIKKMVDLNEQKKWRYKDEMTGEEGGGKDE